MSEIGNRIRDIRTKRGMSQEDLALRCGYTSRSAINKIEAGTRRCSLETAKKIASALQVDADYLIFGDTVNVKSEIIRLLDRMTADQQESALQFLESMLGDRTKTQ